jgi:hypothetical protein
MNGLQMWDAWNARDFSQRGKGAKNLESDLGNNTTKHRDRKIFLAKTLRREELKNDLYDLTTNDGKIANKTKNYA